MYVCCNQVSGSDWLTIRSGSKYQSDYNGRSAGAVAASERFAQALDAAGVRNEFYEIEGAGHFAAQFYQEEILQLILEFAGERVK